MRVGLGLPVYTPPSSPPLLATAHPPPSLSSLRLYNGDTFELQWYWHCVKVVLQTRYSGVTVLLKYRASASSAHFCFSLS